MQTPVDPLFPAASAAPWPSIPAKSGSLSPSPLSSTNLGHPMEVSAVPWRDRLRAITPFSTEYISWGPSDECGRSQQPEPRGSCVLGYAWRRRGESPAALTMCFPQGGKTQILPSSLRLGLWEHCRQCCMPGTGCCRKRASCHGTGPTRVPLSPLSTHPAHFPARSLSCPKAAEQLCRRASNQRVNSLHPHPDGKSNFHLGCAVVGGGQNSPG